MANQPGIAIVIKAFLPTGKTLAEQHAALSLVMKAHETGNYAPLLAAATVDEVKTENKTRRVEDTPAKTIEGLPAKNAASELEDDASGLKEAFDNVEPKGDTDDLPKFLKNKTAA